jgi:hypothetical protein
MNLKKHRSPRVDRAVAAADEDHRRNGSCELGAAPDCLIADSPTIDMPTNISEPDAVPGLCLSSERNCSSAEVLEGHKNIPLSIYLCPYPRRPGSITRQNSTTSAGSPKSSRWPRRFAGARRLPNDHLTSQKSWPALVSESSVMSSEDSLRLDREQSLELLEGHVVPGKLWRRNSTFGDLAKMRIALECHEAVRESSEMLPQRNPAVFPLKRSDAMQDLFEVQHSRPSGWCSPNTKCLNWSEKQLRVAKEKEQEKERGHDEKILLVRKWGMLCQKNIHHAVGTRIRLLNMEYDLNRVVLVQSCARRMLATKRARDIKARIDSKRQAAATCVQSVTRGHHDRVFARFVKSCRRFVDRHHNVFVAHKAFVRAKRNYSGTIQPPWTGVAFANLGDALGASQHAERTLSFVEFCHLANRHLASLASDPMLAKRTASAIVRAGSIPTFARCYSDKATSQLDLEARAAPTATGVAAVEVLPFQIDQDPVLHLAQAMGCLISCYDSSHLGILSERQFSSVCREVTLTTGVAITRQDALFAVRFSRHRGGVNLEVLCALYEVSRMAKNSTATSGREQMNQVDEGRE